MPSTTNFGWTTPADTDLVKDGAAAIRTLGNGVDASFVDLKGGTTGQILSKNSNTDLDFTWIANDQGDITAVTAGTGISGGGTSGAVTITNSMATEITASGDIIVGTGSGTFDNLPIGTTGQVLTADTTVSPYKVKWAAAGKVLQIVEASTTSTLSTTSTSYADITGVTASITPSSASNKVLVMVNFPHTFASVSGSATAYGSIQLLRTSTQINFSTIGWYLASGTTGVGDGYQSASFMNLDSPSTTSSVTYKCQHKTISGVTYYSNYNPGKISIILMEIAV